MSYFPCQWPLRPPYVVVDGPTGPSALRLAGQPWNGVPLCPGHGLPRFPAQLGQCRHAQLNPFAGGSTGVSPCCPTFSGSSPTRAAPPFQEGAAPPFQEVVPPMLCSQHAGEPVRLSWFLRLCPLLPYSGRHGGGRDPRSPWVSLYRSGTSN